MLYSLVAPPALYHHQEVEVMTVDGIVRCEIIAWHGDETPELARQEHIGHYIAVVISWVIRAGVTHSNAENALVLHLSLYSHIDLGIGLQCSLCAYLFAS